MVTPGDASSCAGDRTHRHLLGLHVVASKREISVESGYGGADVDEPRQQGVTVVSEHERTERDLLSVPGAESTEHPQGASRYSGAVWSIQAVASTMSMKR